MREHHGRHEAYAELRVVGDKQHASFQVIVLVSPRSDANLTLLLPQRRNTISLLPAILTFVVALVLFPRPLSTLNVACNPPIAATLITYGTGLIWWTTGGQCDGASCQNTPVGMAKKFSDCGGRRRPSREHLADPSERYASDLRQTTSSRICQTT